MWHPISEFRAVIDRNKHLNEGKDAFVIHGARLDGIGWRFVWIDQDKSRWVWPSLPEAEAVRQAVLENPFASNAVDISVKKLADL
jgi:hypothetical protein